jgi:TRAP transporter TAXI family solute receptor
MRRRTWKKWVGLVSIFVLGSGMLGGALAVKEAMAAPEKIRLTMRGSNTGTWIYMFCAIMVDHWKRYIPDLDITLVATGGTAANYLPMERGEADLAGGTNYSDYWAMHGMHFTKQKLTNFCSFMLATKAISHAFVYAESPIKTWKDMDGKRINLGAKASGTGLKHEEMFNILGIKPASVFSTPTEAVDMIKDRRVDGMVYSVGAPWSAVMDIATDRPIRFISMTPEEQKKITEGLPYVVPLTMPAKTYSFQNEDFHTVTAYQTIMVKPSLSEDIVYKLTKVAWDRWDEVIKATSAAKWVKPQEIVNMYAPIHPGAARYYKEIGIQIPDRLIYKKK